MITVAFLLTFTSTICWNNKSDQGKLWCIIQSNLKRRKKLPNHFFRSKVGALCYDEIPRYTQQCFKRYPQTCKKVLTQQKWQRILQTLFHFSYTYWNHDLTQFVTIVCSTKDIWETQSHFAKVLILNIVYKIMACLFLDQRL